MKFRTVISLSILLISGAIYYDYWEDIDNKDNWEQMPIYNIRMKPGLWQPLDIRFPPQLNRAYSIMEYEVAIPRRYQLKRKGYTIDIEINPSNHSWQSSLQILTTSNSDLKSLKVEPTWAGNCGLIGPTSEKGSWDTRSEEVESLGYPFFTDPKAIGFFWYRGTGYCTEGIPETAEHASSFPIELKIFDGSDLIGEEQIDFEIFQNGIKRYLVTL